MTNEEMIKEYIYAEHELSEETIDYASVVVAKAFSKSQYNIENFSAETIFDDAIADDFLVFADDNEKEEILRLALEEI